MISLKNNKCILVYGLSNAEIIELTKRKIRFIIITKDMTSMKLKDITSGLKFQNTSNFEYSEKVILFNDYEENKLQKSIKEIRSFIKGGILAVVTETSKEWSFDYLINHLIEEREWFKNIKK